MTGVELREDSPTPEHFRLTFRAYLSGPRRPGMRAVTWGRRTGGRNPVAQRQPWRKFAEEQRRLWGMGGSGRAPGDFRLLNTDSFSRCSPPEIDPRDFGNFGIVGDFRRGYSPLLDSVVFARFTALGLRRLRAARRSVDRNIRRKFSHRESGG